MPHECRRQSQHSGAHVCRTCDLRQIYPSPTKWYIHDGRNLYAVSDTDRYVVPGDPARFAIDDLYGPEASSDLADEIRPLFYRTPPFTIRVDTIRALVAQEATAWQD
jgi:hypothetical protein